MDRELLRKNLEYRKQRPTLSGTVKHTVYENHGTIQLAFQSRGCTYSNTGYCVMCDYYAGRNITVDELDKIMDEVLSSYPEGIETLIINSCGSVLDEREIGAECFELLLKKIKGGKVKRVTFETHYRTITEEKIKKIEEYLRDRLINFEIGLESANPKIRENHLLKLISNDEVVETINLLHKHDMTIAVNLLVGIPFLTTKEQLEDALTSIDWCFKHNVDEIVLFPVNVKPYTLLYELYKKGEYQEISHWLLIEVLKRVNDEYLPDIWLAWYGNRQTDYTTGEKNITPTSCEKCEDNIMSFYKEYLASPNPARRRNLINSLIENVTCDCYQNMLKSLNNGKVRGSI